MKIRNNRFFKLFSRRGEAELVEGLRAQLAVVREGTQLVLDVMDGKIKRKAAHHSMQQIEHRGDQRRAELVAMLSRALSTPIDREDMFRLSRFIDDVLDTLRDFVREYRIYKIKATKITRLRSAIEDVVTGVVELDNAVMAMDGNAEQATDSALAARKAGGAVCRKYQYEIAHIFSGEMDSVTMKLGELARRLDVAGSNICAAADSISDGLMKRWR